MIRVHVICEGQTEERFVKEVLLPHFALKKIELSPLNIKGNVTFDRLFTPLSNKLTGDKDAYCTTFFDFYGVVRKFPGKAEALKQEHTKEKHDCLVAALGGEVRKRLGDSVMHRFIPYVQMHEFEALLFSDPNILAEELGLKSSELILRITRNFAPEDINNAKKTTPSQRILKLCPEYQKSTGGALAALAIGLPTIRDKCPLFNDWLRRLENVPEL
jgi:hypothetical protein